MHALDRHIIDCRALVVDSNPTSRSIIASQLRDIGLGTVVQCSKVNDARRHLEVREFDVVLCEQHFPAERYSGQDLLDDLRRAQLLPFSTVFVMITGEANYDKVAEAAESALDSYLLKPHTALGLADRIRRARERKRVLRDIFEAIEDGQFEAAAELCMQRFRSRSQYWLYAARIGAELLLRIGNHAGAQELYEAVIATQALPWAKLGVARAQIENNQTTQAKRTLESLIAASPTYADAYDVMGRVQVEQGKLAEALVTYRQASDLTPGSIMRLQKSGLLAFFMGERDESAKLLERAALIGISSKMFDFQTLVVLAFCRFQQRDTKGLQRCLDNLSHASEKAPKSRRLQRFVQVVRVFCLMLAKQVVDAVAETKALAEELRTPDFDIEAACNMLALVSQLTAAELNIDDADGWIETLGMRFCTAKGVSELLARGADSHPPHAEIVRQCQTRINEMAEQSMAHTLAGDPTSTIKSLIAHGGRTLNAKLVDTARATLQRHQDKIKNADMYTEMLEDMRQRCGLSAAASPLGQDTGRQAGGLTLRTDTASNPDVANKSKFDLPTAA
jgi:CheY-like chemotaxis protein/cytochrome c-type biogenesis protein CcmH/NrfG